MLTGKSGSVGKLFSVDKGTKYVVELGIIISILAFLFTYNPSESRVYAPCPFYALTGLYCPGCGTLRGLHQVLHGHIFTAFEFNPLMVLSIPFVLYSYINRLTCGLTGMWPLPRPFLKAFWIRTLLILILVYWFARNIPVYPLSLLAP